MSSVTVPIGEVVLLPPNHVSVTEKLLRREVADLKENLRDLSREYKRYKESVDAQEDSDRQPFALFTIVCASCGSTNIQGELNDMGSSSTTDFGSEFMLRCRKCGKEETK